MLLAAASRTKMEQARAGLGEEGASITQGWQDVGGRAKGGVTDVGWVGQIGEGKDSSWG